ncbi:hypothetical protein G7046_g5831 [Stylonectria norvegica]|nr:hypothetical protein G7046_g5831 [Stylonectria norvegica]
MSFEGLQDRLAALQETTTQLKDLIDRLADLKFQPGSVPLATDEDSSVSGELSAEISQVLRDGEEEQELLQEEVEFVRADGHEKERLREGTEKLGKELAICRLSFRRARLSAKNSLAQAQRLERELLIHSYSQPVSGATSPLPGDEKAPALPRVSRYAQQQQQQQSSLSEEDQQTVGAASDVTNALRRTHDLIAGELARSEFAHQTLTESSAALAQLDESYGSLDSMLASSRDLLGTLLRSQKSDTWYLQTALYMLAVTGAWLVFRRILYGPLWWLVWLPLRMVFGVGATVGGAVMKGRGGGAGESGSVGAGLEGREVEVDGLPSEDLPTVKVGHEVKTTVGGGDADSMVEQVGKIIDAVNEADELGTIPDEVQEEGSQGIQEEKIAEEQTVPRNTKKRMWEEPAVLEDGRPRDEL